MLDPATIQGIRDSVYLGERRRHFFRVLLFDGVNASDIAMGSASKAPIDISQCVSQIDISMQDEEGATASLTVVADQRWDDPLTPFHFIGSKIVQIRYSDTESDETIPIFTGPCVGQPGYRRTRSEPEQISVQCIDRSWFYNKRKLNSPDFANTGSVDFGDVAASIATNLTWGMGLQREECRFGLFRNLMAHTKIALYDVTYMEGLRYLGFIPGIVPAWDGGGFLVMRDTSLDKPPVRRYQDELPFVEISWQQNQLDTYNAVRVVGLDAAMTKVVSPRQELATVRGTVGYFEDQYRTRVYYSEDRQARAQGVLITDWNLNGKLGAFLGGKKPKLRDVGEYSCVLVIDTPYQVWIFVIFFTTYIAFFIASAIFSYLGWAPASSTMQLLAATWLCLGLAIMQQMGTFEVTISGEPFKMVYKEIEGKAQWAHLQDYEIKELVIENQLVDNQELADSLAFRELRRETVKGHTRTITMPYDPLLAPTDIIELPDGSRYYLTSISISYQRGGDVTMSVSALLIRSGREYNGEPGYPAY